MALTEIQGLARLRSRLNEKSVTTGTWDDSDLLPWLQDSMRDLARRTLCLSGTKTLNTVANQSEYTVSADVLRIYRIEYNPTDGRKIPLQARPYNAMDAIWWSEQDRYSSEPSLYTTWGTPPALTLKLYPRPSASITGGLKLFVARMPADLSSLTTAGATALDMPEGWVEVALDYAEYLALRRDRQIDMMAEVLSQYERKIGDMAGLVEPSVGALDANNEMVFEGPFPLPAWLVSGDGTW